MTKKKTHEEFLAEVFELVGDEYRVIGRYTTTHSKVEIKCNTCNHVFSIQPSSFLSGTRCPQCAIKRRKEKNKKTHKQFVKEVFELVGDEYTVIGRYVNLKLKLAMKHNTCKHVWETIPSNFLKGHGCNKCANNIKKSHEQYVQEVYGKVGEEYTVVGNYVNSFTKIDIRHNTCGKTNSIFPPNILKGSRCRHCFGKIKKTHEEYVAEVYKLEGNNYSVLSDYINSKIPIKMRHNECENEYTVRPSEFLKGNRCYNCRLKENAQKKTKTPEQFTSEVFELVGDEFTVIGKYIHGRTDLEIMHSECGKIFAVKPFAFRITPTCPLCSKGVKITQENFVKRVYELEKDEYSVTGKVLNAKTPVQMKHNKCGREYLVAPSNFFGGKRCPKCKDSKGEIAIEKWLESKKISFHKEFTISECRYKKPLPFDFAVFKDDGTFILIEYQGLQHYRSVERYGGKEGFEERKRNDKIKKDYCIANNIPMIEIPFWHLKKIDQILDKELPPLNLQQAVVVEKEQLVFDF